MTTYNLNKPVTRLFETSSAFICHIRKKLTAFKVSAVKEYKRNYKARHLDKYRDTVKNLCSRSSDTSMAILKSCNYFL